MKRKKSIKDVLGTYMFDLNFRKQGRGSTSATHEDYPELTPEYLVDWCKRIGSDDVALNYLKLQSGYASYKSKFVPKMKHMADDFYQRYGELSRKEGMYVLSYTCGGDDRYMYEEHPEWFEHYGRFFVCLNTKPFWDREFAMVKESLEVFMPDGLFYDMIKFDGKCKCAFCQETYKNLYGRSLLEDAASSEFERMRKRFVFDTFKNWVERATTDIKKKRPECGTRG